MISVDVFEFLEVVPLSSVDAVLSLGEIPHVVRRQGRRFSRIFCFQPISVALFLNSVDCFVLDFRPGWNSFDIPDGSKIVLVGDDDVKVIHRVFDICG